MRNSSKLFAAVAAASLVAVGGTAFTASNSVPTGDLQGYGEVVSSGATITEMTVATVTGDASRLESVVFSTTTDLATADQVEMTLKNGSALVGTSYTCGVTGSASPWTITCDATDDPLLNAFDTIGITVVNKTV